MVALCNSILPAHLKETKVNIMARLYELPQFFILQVSNALAESLQPGMSQDFRCQFFQYI